MRDATLAASKKIEVRGGTLRTVGRGGPRASIGMEPVTVGRGEACGLVLADRKVSAIHLELTAGPLGVRVLDKGSLNGTFIAGVRIADAHLTEPTRIVVGDTTLAFEPTGVERVALGRATTWGRMVGASTSMRLVFDRLARAAPTDLTVLVTGETGTGKEVVAQALHENGARQSGPFVIVDCGAIPAGLAESFLFGHARGAFTGASSPRQSPFVDARGGTIFLDEIGELPIELQPKLLRVIAERRVKPVGSNAYLPVDVRIVAATRVDLSRAVNDGTFRSDLYFRLAQLRLELPPLRERPEDIPLLLNATFTELGDPGALGRVPEAAMQRLLRHQWPGNIRELKTAATVAFTMADGGGIIDPAAYLGEVTGPPGTLESLSYKEARRIVLDRFEVAYFRKQVAQASGNLTEVARRSGIARGHVRRYVRRHDLLPERPAAGGRRKDLDTATKLEERAPDDDES